jgi:hypothetical protein
MRKRVGHSRQKEAPGRLVVEFYRAAIAAVLIRFEILQMVRMEKIEQLTGGG